MVAILRPVKNLANYLKTLSTPIYGIWGMTKNKNPDSFIKEFKGLFKKIVTIPIENEQASVSNKLLFKIAQRNSFRSELANNLTRRLKK